MKFSHLEKIEITALSKVAYSTEYIDLCYFKLVHVIDMRMLKNSRKFYPLVTCLRSYLP